MTTESFSKKLSDLFELFNSGALSKEEFETLKKQILSEGGAANIEDEKKQKQENTKVHDKPIKVKKGGGIWKYAIIGMVIIIAVFFLLKTIVIPYKSADSYMIGAKTLNANLLPHTGAYKKVEGYSKVIIVSVKNGKMSFQVGTDMNDIYEDEPTWISDSGVFSLSTIDGEIKYIGNGEIELSTYEPYYGTTTKRKFIREGNIEQPNKEKVLSASDPGKFLKSFFVLYKRNDGQIDVSINSEVGLIILSNPGSRCIGEKSSSLRFMELNIPEKNVFESKPIGDKCGGYSENKDGFYFKEINEEGLPSYVISSDEWVDVKLPPKYSSSKIIQVLIIQNEFWQSTFFFAQIDGSWYLFCQDFCDCSS
jgi:Short C-terminal domain